MQKMSLFSNSAKFLLRYWDNWQTGSLETIPNIKDFKKESMKR